MGINEYCVIVDHVEELKSIIEKKDREIDRLLQDYKSFVDRSNKRIDMLRAGIVDALDWYEEMTPESVIRDWKELLTK